LTEPCIDLQTAFRREKERKLINLAVKFVFQHRSYTEDFYQRS
jgi:hypothetical protein